MLSLLDFLCFFISFNLFLFCLLLVLCILISYYIFYPLFCYINMSSNIYFYYLLHQRNIFYLVHFYDSRKANLSSFFLFFFLSLDKLESLSTETLPRSFTSSVNFSNSLGSPNFGQKHAGKRLKLRSSVLSY